MARKPAATSQSDDEQRDKLRDSRVTRVRIDGARAEVTIAGGDTPSFEKVDGDWKVRSSESPAA